jgi:hypothetical protein
MANRFNQQTDGKPDKLTRQDALAAASYISENLSSGSSRTRDNPRFDDLIVSLANAHENRRARQVNEWEEMRPNYLRLNT